MTDAPYQWIESTSWELEFFGLPNRIPWPSNVDPKLASSDPFEMNHLLDAVESMGADAPEPFGRFLKASEHLDEFGEAVQNSEIVRAYELLEKFDEQFPDTAFALYHRGSLSRLEGDDEGAVELFEQAAAKAPRGVAIWNSIGVVNATQGKRDEAVAAFKKALAVSPQDRTALDGLVQMREMVKLLRNAKDPNSAFYMDLPTFGQMAMRQVQQLVNDPEQLLNYGEQLLREGYAPEAGLAAMQRAVEARPDDARAVIGLTMAYRTQGKLEEARATITPFTEKHPEDPRGFFFLATVCNALGDAEGERKALDRVLELDPNAQQPLGIRFGLNDAEHDPAKESELARWAEERKSWMAYILASNIARKRGDAKAALKWAEKSYEIAPENEDVVLHLTAALGEARDFEKMVRIVKPLVESGKYSKRLNWNYAQVLQQTGLTDDAIRVLRDAAQGEVPPDFKAAVVQTIEAWSGELTGCGVRLEVHQAGFLQRPVLLTIDGEEGGIVLAAGAKVPTAGGFPWRSKGPETRIQLQQGESGGSLEVQPLGAFVVKGIEPANPIDCHIVAQQDGSLLFRARQGNRNLKVGWMPLGLDKA
ncbi:tetratricopeptide repeat protein [Chthoniobacter flavus]|uniref:tetratricopeptide repeat protein n=1 Tax=Chthoniobacter flavus TaxID=191863 RepID=UPI001043DD91|nr:tetratricopeptide repeat protein [Chthoniobacter flavus]TCO85550.1 tetratricopeptide repeat protein [Chthoniobacter flavus]